MLEELRKSNRENQQLQTKLILLYEGNKGNNGAQNDSDWSSTENNDQIFQNSKLFINSRDENFDINNSKSGEIDEDDDIIQNSKSMMIGYKHRASSALGKSFYNTNKHNYSMVADNNCSRIMKKVLLEKDQKLEEKNKEMEEISKMYEDRLKELNKSRNEERSQYEQNIKELGSSFRTITKKRNIRHTTMRTKTPVAVIDWFLPEKKEGLDWIDDESNDGEEVEEPKSKLFSKIDEMQDKYLTLRKSIASQIGTNERDSLTVNHMEKTIFDDEDGIFFPATKSTWSNDFSEFDILMSPKPKMGKH